MSIHNLFLTENKYNAVGRPSFSGLRKRVEKYSEGFWCTLSFLLFVLMGPFSVFAVLIGLWSLANGEHKNNMVEPASC